MKSLSESILSKEVELSPGPIWPDYINPATLKRIKDALQEPIHNLETGRGPYHLTRLDEDFDLLTDWLAHIKGTEFGKVLGSGNIQQLECIYRPTRGTVFRLGLTVSYETSAHLEKYLFQLEEKYRGHKVFGARYSRRVFIEIH